MARRDVRPARSALAEADLLRAVPQHAPPELAQVLVSFLDRGEMVARERPRLARERDVAVRKQQLGLADAAGEDDQLAGAGIASRVLGPDAEVEVAPRDPASLPAPAHVDDLRLQRQHP